MTYLTEKASPKVILPHRYNEPEDHLVFDGRLLHGAPAHLALRQISGQQSADLRVTFLVNLWLSSHPSGVNELSPEIREAILNVSAAASPEFSLMDMPSDEIQRIQLLELEEDNQFQIELPFVLKGATWVDDENGPNLVFVT